MGLFEDIFSGFDTSIPGATIEPIDQIHDESIDFHWLHGPVEMIESEDDEY